jgi:hypothetical protein
MRTAAALPHDVASFFSWMTWLFFRCAVVLRDTVFFSQYPESCCGAAFYRVRGFLVNGYRRILAVQSSAVVGPRPQLLIGR